MKANQSTVRYCFWNHSAQNLQKKNFGSPEAFNFPNLYKVMRQLMQYLQYDAMTNKNQH